MIVTADVDLGIASSFVKLNRNVASGVAGRLPVILKSPLVANLSIAIPLSLHQVHLAPLRHLTESCFDLT